MPDDHAAITRRIVATGDPLAGIDRDIAGSPHMQLRWSIYDQHEARTVATILRALANDLEVYSDTRRNTPRDAHALMRAARKRAQDRLDSLRKPVKKLCR